METVFTNEQYALAKTTVSRVLCGEITQDAAVQLLTANGIPVIKTGPPNPPAKKRLAGKTTRRLRKKK